MPTSSFDSFRSELASFSEIVEKAKRGRFSLSSHKSYAPKARASLAALRKFFLMLKRDHPAERFGRVAFQLATIEPLVSKLVEVFPSSPKEMLSLLGEMRFKVDSDLAAEVEAPEATPQLSTTAPFLPFDLIEDKHGVLKKVLWEANRCYEAACYNACAAMIRRMVESLLLEAFERLGIGHKIKRNDEYLKLNALIGKAIAEPKLRLTRNTKRALPDLKFFGDMGAHNRMALVRKADLDRLHNQTRVTLEELARHL